VTLTTAQLVIASVAVLILIALFAANRYRVAGANEALIISGARGSKIRDEAGNLTERDDRVSMEINSDRDEHCVHGTVPARWTAAYAARPGAWRFGRSF